MQWNNNQLIHNSMSFFCHIYIIVPLESDDQNYRVCAVHALVHKLPERNKEMLELLMQHLVTYVSL